MEDTEEEETVDETIQDSITEVEDKVDQNKEKRSKPTAVAIRSVLTDEEIKQRNEKRIAMSECCVAEAWAYYRKVTCSDRPMSVLYDPDMDRRLAFLGRKYKYLLEGFHQIKEAPSKPYIRPQPPRELNVSGRHVWLPRAVRVQMPEVETDYTLPLVVSAKGRTLKIFNQIFVDDDLLKDAETQTWRHDSQQMSRRWAKKKDWVTCRDTVIEEFDLEDHPLDSDGNPVGKSTGHCEWCHQEILPLPTPYTLKNTWDKERLYCCKKYMDCCMEVDAFEAALKEEMYVKDPFISIDTKPSKKKSSDITVIKKQEYNKKKRKESLHKKIKESKSGEKKEQTTETHSLAIDTFDLPWDPYESRFGHPRYFNDLVFDDSEYHTYPHPDVVLSQSGTYIDDKAQHPAP